MIIPLGDAPNYAESRPWVNYGLIAVNVFVYLWAVSTHASEGGYQAWVQEWGFVPVAPRIETFFTSMFMHGGFLHLAGNMLFLWIFGDNVEGRLGHVGYLLSYLACGLAAVLLFRILAPDSTVPMVGASGAIFGVEGFYFLAFPKNRVRVLVWVLILWWFWISARVFLGISFLINLVYMLSPAGGKAGGGVAYAAHVGGFAFGLLLVIGLKLTRPRAEVIESDAPMRTRTPSRRRRGPALALEEARRDWEAGRHGEAEARLQGVIRQHVYAPEAPEAALQLGMLQSRVLGRPDAARAALKFAARLHPDPAQREAALREIQRLS